MARIKAVSEEAHSAALAQATTLGRKRMASLPRASDDRDRSAISLTASVPSYVRRHYKDKAQREGVTFSSLVAAAMLRSMRDDESRNEVFDEDEDVGSTEDREAALSERERDLVAREARVGRFEMVMRRLVPIMVGIEEAGSDLL